MTKEERKTLEKRLLSLDSHERQKLFKRAAQIRKLAQRKNNTRPRRAYLSLAEDDEPSEIGGRQPQSSLHDWALKLLGEEESAESTRQPVRHPVGTVIAVGHRSAEVVLGQSTLTCLLSKELAENQQTDIAVGDLVEVDRRGHDVAIIESVQPRRTKLSRPDPHATHRERVIVANVDVVAVVVSVVSPPLHPRLIDRYLIAIRRGGADAVICVNKADLLEPEAFDRELHALRPYDTLDLPVIRCSASKGLGRDELFGVLQGRVSAFVGHSGVGKSSLLNMMKPELGLAVGGVSQGYDRGTHTTTRSTMWDLGKETYIIDTPGVRSFGLWKLEADELPWYFPEFAVAGGCKFRDCGHTHEPQCAVKAAVEAGDISRDRYDTYLRILESL
ncbi:MAG TPA: ribosome small subunit-dependent GTPase A [Fimbriimonadaceae bacterium]|nr:ribosome small subunit-dependent GTPase A [Fimbriimonadaceae bacterium]